MAGLNIHSSALSFDPNTAAAFVAASRCRRSVRTRWARSSLEAVMLFVPHDTENKFNLATLDGHARGDAAQRSKRTLQCVQQVPCVGRPKDRGKALPDAGVC